MSCERVFLPAKFTPTGEYSKRQLDRARGYRLLVHAEIEAYLEDLAWNLLREKLGDWKKGKKISPPILSVLACYRVHWDLEQLAHISKSSKYADERVDEIIDLAVKQYITARDSNHGIRIKNLKDLMIPVGVKVQELDSSWLVDLDEFGKQRGEVAHKSAGTQQIINPKDELDRVSSIINGLEKLDEVVHNIARTT